MAMKMIECEFIGWVEEINPADQYRQEVVVRNYKEQSDAPQYPMALKFSASVKSGASSQLVGVTKGDKVQVNFFVTGRSGVSSKTNKYYCFNELQIKKSGGFAILEMAPRPGAEQPAPKQEEEELPF